MPSIVCPSHGRAVNTQVLRNSCSVRPQFSAALHPPMHAGPNSSARSPRDLRAPVLGRAPRSVPARKSRDAASHPTLTVPAREQLGGGLALDVEDIADIIDRHDFSRTAQHLTKLYAAFGKGGMAD